MKTFRIRSDQIKSRGKSKPKLDQKMISRIGDVLYQFDEAKEVSINVDFKDGTTVSYNRSEDEDDFQEIKRRMNERFDDER